MEEQICSRRQELIEEVQGHLIRLAELAREEAAVMGGQDQTRWLEVDKRIENTLGEKERAMGALNEHRKEHGC
jgi:hypothetical protein